jgi:hypothetical protein
LEDPLVDARIILRLICGKWDMGLMDLNDLAQGRGRWRGLVNAVMIPFWFHEMREFS